MRNRHEFDLADLLGLFPTLDVRAQAFHPVKMIAASIAQNVAMNAFMLVVVG